ncbi:MULTISPECIES: (2Fe-2S) ferredoxin domain-containing protein [Ectothiorhodospira]|uniref:(2Fe-2S) ferredoxin n=1 Tax=Ectothiorhodospira marina TaxID=1396821 RepID=A0A1H7L8W6_9GAMM|nr:MULTISPECIES: 2Fe-2S ferredoxin [Ectothiorhodospira]MCG5517382.1 (2Fe-2S) ferredoxin domain-containing protein [Ectothiorhodospira sp. 9100]MCG5520274.1 (2Fe-2S) ferredoxin domain-containing protein [Ectothiorhodospira sp. 9905]SEK95493.1 (2Fe-2S) ferredoxin [Ectothiorhodospira marina]
MAYYKRHIFFCTNDRDDGNCCEHFRASELRNHAKQRAKALNLTGKGGVRVNVAGCLDRCNEGPVAVVYPEGVWYTFADEQDIDEIVDEHLQHGRVVERLKL